MVGMAGSCMGGSALGNYVMQEDKGYELMRNGVSGEKPTEIMKEMRIIQDLNQRARNRTFSLVLSPEMNEGQKLSDTELRTLTKEFMNELKIDPQKQQYIAFVHTEKAHKHIHIIANRVKEDGKLIPDHHIGKKAQWAAHRVAKSHGLVSAKEKMINKLKSQKHQTNFDKSLKKEIRKKHDWVMKHKPKSMQVYFAIMEKLGVKVTPTINKSGRVQGMRMKDLATGKDFKASEVHRSLSLPKIMKTGIPYESPQHDNVPKNQTSNSTQLIKSFETAFKLGSSGYSNQVDEDLSTVNKKRKKRKKRRKGLER